MANCQNCKNEIPSDRSDKYCSDNCLMEFMNNLRLFYQDDLSGDREMMVINSRIGLMRLNQHATMEELGFRAQLLIEAAAHLNTIVYSTKHRDETYARTKREAEQKLHIAHYVDERDSKKVLSAEELREKQASDKEAKRQKALKAELKKTGDLPSINGKCSICNKESLSLYCSSVCKKRFKMLKQWTSIGMDVESAKAKIMQLDPSVFADMPDLKSETA